MKPGAPIAVIAVGIMSVASCSSSDGSAANDELAPFLLDPDDPNIAEYDFEVPAGAMPVIGVFSLASDGFVDEIDAAIASVDDPMQEEFFGCDPVVAWIQPSGDRYDFDWEEGFVDCAEAVPYLAIYELPE